MSTPPPGDDRTRELKEKDRSTKAIRATEPAARPGETISIPDGAAPLDTRAPLARLVPKPGQPGAAEILLYGSHEVIGRDYPATLRINHPAISGEHARIEVRDGVWRITDLKAKNPIKVNDKPAREATLKPGDSVKLGAWVYVFQDSAARPKSGRVKWLAALGLFALAAVILVASLQQTPERRPRDSHDGDLAARIVDGLSTMQLSGIDELLSQVKNPSLRKSLTDAKVDTADALRTGQELRAAALRCLDDPSASAIEHFRTAAHTFLQVVPRLRQVPGMPDAGPLQDQLRNGERAATDGETAITRWKQLCEADSLPKRVKALQAVSDWVSRASPGEVTTRLTRKTDGLATECFEKALRAFDFDAAHTCAACVFDRRAAQELEARLKAESELLARIANLAATWYKNPTPVAKSSVLCGLLERMAAAQAWHDLLGRTLRQVEEEIQKDSPNAPALARALESGLAELHAVSADVRRFPGNLGEGVPAPRSLQFLASFREPAIEWGPPVQQTRVLLDQWPQFQGAVQDCLGDEKKPDLAAFRRAAEQGRKTFLISSSLADEKLKSLVAVAAVRTLDMLKPCLASMLNLAEVARKKNRYGEEAGILRTIRDCSWCTNARDLVGRAEARLLDIEREGKRHAVRAYLYQKLGEAKEAEENLTLALEILGASHPWAKVISP